jgi:2-amino-4-hydroxy-6-hydroxymethyldihydropteridine diphosphokinase
VNEVFVAIGSNVEPEKNVRAAVKLLREKFGTLRLSPVYRNPPVGFEGADFFNLVISFDTEIGVADVQAALGEIELACGRERDARRLAPRTIDLDLLLYGDLVSPKAKLPRPDILKYAFVLKPLVDLAPENWHPTTGHSFSEYWRDFSGDKNALQRVELPDL